MGATVDKVASIGDYADKTFKQVANDQKEYDMKLAKISGFTANHDDELVQQLEDKAFKLEQSHKRLLDWQRKEKHQTRAWRNEVERRLKQLETKLENEQTNIEGDQLNAVMNVQNQMGAAMQAQAADEDAEHADIERVQQAL